MNNYTELEEKYWHIYQVLVEYFKEVDSLEVGQENFLRNSKEVLTISLPKLKEFVETGELNLTEKEKFIRNYVNYRFQDNNLNPIDWLKNFINQIEEHLKKN